MNNYAKLFGSMLASSVWSEPHATRIVWVTLMLMSDRDGMVEASVDGIAHFARVTIAECEAAMVVLSSPDPRSKSKAHDGRRVIQVDGGWSIVNYEFYRDKQNAEDRKEAAARRQQRKRDRDASSRSVTPRHAPSRAVTDVTPSDSGSSLTQDEGRKEEPAPPSPETKQQKGINEALIELGIYDIVAEKRLRLVQHLDANEVDADRIREMWTLLLERYPKDHDRAAGMLCKMLSSAKPISKWHTLKFSGRKPRNERPVNANKHVPNMPIGSDDCPECVAYRKKHGR